MPNNLYPYYPVIVMLSIDGPGLGRRQRYSRGRLDEMGRRMVLNSAEVHTLVWGRGLGTRNWGAQAVFGEILAENTRGSFDYFTEPADLVDKLSKLGRNLANKHLLVSNRYRVSYQPPQNSSGQLSLGVVTSREGIDIFPTFDGNVPARMSEP
ncbi:MAG: hypothetical protein VYE68_12880 [Acidobacteriota bacterium]|nr:hypothetical protein [Acidobacteriota bacterium]